MKKAACLLIPISLSQSLPLFTMKAKKKSVPNPNDDGGGDNLRRINGDRCLL